MDSCGSRITLKDLAQEAGLSVAAVSMGLRNHPRIGKDTCKRIQALALKRGYQPDPALSALIAYRQNLKNRPVNSTIAVVYVNSERVPSIEREIKEEFQGIKKIAEALGYGLDKFFVSLDASDQIRTLKVIYNRGIRGIIFQFLDCEPCQFKADWGLVSAVGLGIVSEKTDLPLPIVCADHFHDSYECVRQLAKLGYSRPSLILPSAFPSTLQIEILGGYVAGLRECSGSPAARDLQVDFANAAWKVKIISFIKRKGSDVLICAGRADELSHLLNSEDAPPEAKKASVCTLDAEPENEQVGGILQDRRSVGAVAMETLHRLILANIRGPMERQQTIQIPGKWRIAQLGRRLLQSNETPRAPKNGRSATRQGIALRKD